MSAAEVGELIATKGLAVVRKLARQFAASNDVGLDVDDFMSLGQATLVEVAPAFQDLRNVRFTTYIFPYVRGAMQDAVRRKVHEISVQSLIDHAVERETRRFSAHQSDEFDILFDPTEQIQTRLDANLSDLAIGHVTRAAAAALRLMQQGTEDHLGELQEYALVADIIQRTVARLPARLQRLWQLHYVEDRPLKDFVTEAAISEATAGRDHKALREALEGALRAAGIAGLPDVD